MRKFLLMLSLATFAWGCGGSDGGDSFNGGDAGTDGIVLYGMGYDQRLRMDTPVEFSIGITNLYGSPITVDSCYISLPDGSNKADATYSDTFLGYDVTYKITCTQRIGKMECAGVDVPLHIDSSDVNFNYSDILTTCNLPSGTLTKTVPLKWEP